VTAPTGQRLTLREMSQAILDAVVAHFAAAGVALPERRYVAPGDPAQIAWDCEQLVVALQGVGWGQSPSAGQALAKTGTMVGATGVRHAVFVIALIRCTPSDGDRDTGIPDAADIHAAGLDFMTDMGLLSQALLEACAVVQAGFSRSALVEPGVVDPQGPSGTMHGMTAQLSITAGELV